MLRKITITSMRVQSPLATRDDRRPKRKAPAIAGEENAQRLKRKTIEDETTTWRAKLPTDGYSQNSTPAG